MATTMATAHGEIHIGITRAGQLPSAIIGAIIMATGITLIPIATRTLILILIMAMVTLIQVMVMVTAMATGLIMVVTIINLR